MQRRICHIYLAGADPARFLFHRRSPLLVIYSISTCGLLVFMRLINLLVEVKYYFANNNLHMFYLLYTSTHYAEKFR